MEKREVAKKIQKFIEEDYNAFFTEYINKYRDNIGYLKFYPLLSIEEKFLEAGNTPEIYAFQVFPISWFVSNVNKRINQKKFSNFIFNIEEFTHFKKTYANKIEKIYWNYKVNIGINDIVSPVGYSLQKLNDIQYRLTWPLITQPLAKEQIYFHMAFDIEKLERERKTKLEPNMYLGALMTDDLVSNITVLKKMLKHVDNTLYELCIECVRVDIQKLGGNIKSRTIKSSEDLIRFISYFYYYSLISKSIFSFSSLYDNASSMNLNLIQVSKKKLEESLIQITKIHKSRIDNLLNYFIFKGKGSINEFPLFKEGSVYYWLPSSWILNDFQFSIVNGHYYKEVFFENRDKTISHSIVKEIEEKVRGYKNIIVKTEHYYEYKSGNNLENSDIDVAIFDKKNNVLLVIECKWKDNFYAIAGEESYRKIHQGLREIYKGQINKHKHYVEQIDGSLNSIFKGEIEKTTKIEEIEIFYMVVDKRSQLYIEEMNLVPLFGLLYIMEINKTGLNLELNKVVQVIKSFKTKIEYINSDQSKSYKIDNDITLLTEDLEF